MKKYEQIVIKKDTASLKKLLSVMKAYKDNDFYWDNDGEDNPCSAHFKTDKEELYFAVVHVCVNENELRVSDITSSNPKYLELSVTRYNHILNHFFHHFIAKCLDESFANCISVEGEEVSLENLLGKEVYANLENWEKNCDKDAPVSNYSDEQSWFKFICSLHANNKRFHPSDLGQWLSEDCKWPSYYNNNIILLEENLENSLSLLNYYDGRYSGR